MDPDGIILTPELARRLLRMLGQFERGEIGNGSPGPRDRAASAAPGPGFLTAIWDGIRVGKVYRGHLLGPAGTAEPLRPVQWKYPNDAGTADLIEANDLVSLRPAPPHELTATDWGDEGTYGPRTWALTGAGATASGGVRGVVITGGTGAAYTGTFIDDGSAVNLTLSGFGGTGVVLKAGVRVLAVQDGATWYVPFIPGTWVPDS